MNNPPISDEWGVTQYYSFLISSLYMVSGIRFEFNLHSVVGRSEGEYMFLFLALTL